MERNGVLIMQAQNFDYQTKKSTWRKTILIIIAICGAALLVAGVFALKQYYDANYVVDDYYYTVVPLDYDITPVGSYDSAGELRDYEKTYDLPCYNADGGERQLQFRAIMSFQELYPPGMYVRVSVSKTTVLGQNAIAKEDIPGPALARIQENFVPSAATTLEEYAQERTRQLAARNTPSLKISCVVVGTPLVYTYTFSVDAKEIAEQDAILQDFVYRAQFRADQETLSELTAIFLEIKLDDGTVIFSQKYDQRVTFNFDLE
jgi:uncharacterized protein YxeA